MADPNAFINALQGPSWLDVGNDAVVNYHFADDYGFAWLAKEKAVFDAVFGAFASVCNLSFVETDRIAAEIVQNKVSDYSLRATDPPIAWHGWHDEPGAGERSGFYDYTKSYWSTTLVPGGTAYWLVLHEIGHGIGLEHPHSTWHGSGLFPKVRIDASNDPGDFGHNSNLGTTMSYRSFGGAMAATPMAFDIATLQKMYGANMSTGSGDNVYQVHSGYLNCIWDAGGADAINGTSANDIIDLRPAPLANTPGGGGWLSHIVGRIGGFTIANGVEIENAYGGNGNDRLQGNWLDNFLWGGAGNDFIIGGGGADAIAGGGGFDKLYTGNDARVDVVYAGNGDTIYQFDNGEDNINLVALDVDWVTVVTVATGKWEVRYDRDSDPQVDGTITVLGQRPILSTDFIL